MIKENNIILITLNKKYTRKCYNTQKINTSVKNEVDDTAYSFYNTSYICQYF